MSTLYEHLYVGMKVYDKDDNIGTIVTIDDIHNIWVEFNNGDAGYHCLEENCRNYNQLLAVSCSLSTFKI